MLKRFPVTKKNDEVGYTPIQCYVLTDSHGDRDGPHPCIDYDTLDRVMRGKENINLQIKMWVEGVIEGTSFPTEIKEWTKDYPEWVFKSFLNQLHKEVTKKIGFVPTFMRNI